MPSRVRNFTQLFKSAFASVLASIAIANEMDETILNEAGEDINAEDETILAHRHGAGRMGGIKVAIMPSTGGFSA